MAGLKSSEAISTAGVYSKGLVPTLINLVFEIGFSVATFMAFTFVDNLVALLVPFVADASAVDFDAVSFVFFLFFGHSKELLRQCPSPPQAAHVFAFFFGATF